MLLLLLMVLLVLVLLVLGMLVLLLWINYRGAWESGQNMYTPEITRVNFHWNMSLTIHWTFPIPLRGWRNTVGNLIEILLVADKWGQH